MRRDSFNVLFFIKKTKLLKNGEGTVCMRITVNGGTFDFSKCGTCLSFLNMTYD